MAVTTRPEQTFFGVWGSSASDVFAVGGGGVILHYNGSTWTQMSSNTGEPLFGVWGSSASDVFTAGSGGIILRYNGSTWTDVASSNTNTLRGVWRCSSADTFAVGVAGTILHFVPATITSVEPDKGYQGETLSVNIIGSHFSSTTSVSLGAGISVDEFVLNSASQITAEVTVDKNAATGARDVSVFMPGGSGVLTGGFSVTVPPPILPPTILGINPGSGRQGETLNVSIIGSDFIEVSEVSLGSGIAVNSYSMVAPNQIIASVSIDRWTLPGERDVLVTNPGGTDTKAGGFRVIEISPGFSPFYWPWAWWVWLILFLLLLLLVLFLLWLLWWRRKPSQAEPVIVTDTAPFPLVPPVMDERRVPRKEPESEEEPITPEEEEEGETEDIKFTPGY